MSFLLSLDESDSAKIIARIDSYEKRIAAAEPIFQLEHRRIEEVARTLPHYLSEYDRYLQELKALEDWLTTIKDKKVAKAWKKYNEGYSRTLTTRDIQAYIGGEKEIVDINQLIVEVTLLKNLMNAIVEALKQMGWMISHITKLRVAEMQDAIL